MAIFFLIVFVLWASGFYIQKTIELAGVEAFVKTQSLQWFEGKTLLASFIGLFLTGINAFLISQLGLRFSIIRVRSLMPVFVFLLLVSSWHETHLLLLSHFTLSLILISLFILFGIYRDRNATEQLFLASLLVAVCSLIFQAFLLFIPLFLVGLLYSRSFSFRGLLASITGVIAVWGIYFFTIFLFSQTPKPMSDVLHAFALDFTILHRPINEIIYVAIIFVIGLIGIVAIKSNLHQESMQTRSHLNFIILLTLCAFSFSMLLQNYFHIFLPIAAMGFSFILGHCFTIRKSKLFSYLFLIFIVTNLLYIVSNLYLHAL